MNLGVRPLLDASEIAE